METDERTWGLRVRSNCRNCSSCVNEQWVEFGDEAVWDASWKKERTVPSPKCSVQVPSYSTCTLFTRNCYCYCYYYITRSTSSSSSSPLRFESFFLKSSTLHVAARPLLVSLSVSSSSSSLLMLCLEFLGTKCGFYLLPVTGSSLSRRHREG